MKSLTTKVRKGNIMCKPWKLIWKIWRWVLQSEQVLFKERMGFGFLRQMVSPAGPSLPRLQPTNIFCCILRYQVKPVAAMPVTCFTLKQQPGC
jgi:hypothetical protein